MCCEVVDKEHHRVCHKLLLLLCAVVVDIYNLGTARWHVIGHLANYPWLDVMTGQRLTGIGPPGELEPQLVRLGRTKVLPLGEVLAQVHKIIVNREFLTEEPPALKSVAWRCVWTWI